MLNGMKRMFFGIVVVGIVVFSACQEKKESVYQLQPADEILRIELDSLTSNISEWLDFYYDEQLDSLRQGLRNGTLSQRSGVHFPSGNDHVSAVLMHFGA